MEIDAARKRYELITHEPLIYCIYILALSSGEVHFYNRHSWIFLVKKCAI